jgi:hypothetical protein
MGPRTIAVTAVLLAGLGLGVGAAEAGSVYGLPVAAEDMSGSRSVGAGLETDVDSWGGNTIAWDITLQGSYYTYEYRFIGFNGLGSTISHINLDVTDDAVGPGDEVLRGTIWGLTITDLGEQLDSPDDDALFCPSPWIEGVPVDNGNGAIPGSIKIQCPDGGADWPTNSLVSFHSYRSPVYGHIGIKTGVGELWNTGWADPDPGDPQDFIARPNGLIPEPLTVLCVVVGVGGLAGYVRKRRAAA